MTATEILKLIETVDPSDTKTLDEIDARVHLTVSPLGDDLIKYHKGNYDKALEHAIFFCHAKPYTRSRDALKSIRPKNTTVWIKTFPHDNAVCDVVQWIEPIVEFGERYEFTGRAITEELAELHAIIQAIEYERNKK